MDVGLNNYLFYSYFFYLLAFCVNSILMINHEMKYNNIIITISAVGIVDDIVIITEIKVVDYFSCHFPLFLFF